MACHEGCACHGLACPVCGAQLTLQLVTKPTSPPSGGLPLIHDDEVVAPPVATPDAVGRFATPPRMLPPVVEAPSVWTLPMQFRQHNPWGYLHGQLNAKGQLHPGYDLNNGPDAQADLGEPLYAVRPGTVVYAKRTPGWGTLLAILLDESVDGRRVAVRYGHPDTIIVPWGAHVAAGQLVGTCGDGKLPGSYTPHLHYDLVDVGVLWEVTEVRGLGKPDLAYYGQGQNRALFDRLYLDPRRFHPEIDSALRRVGK
jgi:murein DD-endopeptidase MepM/ murein hydrolase activator NlpD